MLSQMLHLTIANWGKMPRACVTQHLHRKPEATEKADTWLIPRLILLFCWRCQLLPLSKNALCTCKAWCSDYPTGRIVFSQRICRLSATCRALKNDFFTWRILLWGYLPKENLSTNNISHEILSVVNVESCLAELIGFAADTFALCHSQEGCRHQTSSLIWQDQIIDPIRRRVHQKATRGILKLEPWVAPGLA